MRGYGNNRPRIDSICLCNGGAGHTDDDKE